MKLPNKGLLEWDTGRQSEAIVINVLLNQRLETVAVNNFVLAIDSSRARTPDNPSVPRPSFVQQCTAHVTVKVLGSNL